VRGKFAITGSFCHGDTEARRTAKAFGDADERG
jgi:hypothetical protein